MPKFYITTSIAYVNARPHIGYALEVIQADCLARYHRLKGDQVFYLTGTDEHGMKLVQTAKEQGLTPQALVDQNAAHFKALETLLNLSNDRFIRTTESEHTKSVQKLWLKLVEAGDIYKGTYEGLYCIGCEAFITEKDLVDGKCPNHQRAPEKLKEENYFFKLSRYSEKIRKLIESNHLKVVPQERKNEILGILKEGLKDISFSRPKEVLQWGIEVPNDPTQVMYVWCDALSNYLTGVDYLKEGKHFKQFWPPNVQLVGKDIIRFHAAIWIGMLLSAGLDPSHSIYVHGFITAEGTKMSKSLNNVVDPVTVVNQYGADALRYYLLKEIPTTGDGDFSKTRFQIVYESELANNIGNLVSRVLAMTHKYFDSKVPQVKTADAFFSSKVKKLWQDYDAAVGAFDLKRALEEILKFADAANEYVEAQKPWVLAKMDQQKLAEVLYNLLESIRHLALLLLPFIPLSAGKILIYLGFDPKKVQFDEVVQWGKLQAGVLLGKVDPLFPKIESEKV